MWGESRLAAAHSHSSGPSIYFVYFASPTTEPLQVLHSFALRHDEGDARIYMYSDKQRTVMFHTTDCIPVAQWAKGRVPKRQLMNKATSSLSFYLPSKPTAQGLTFLFLFLVSRTSGSVRSLLFTTPTNYTIIAHDLDVFQPSIPQHDATV
jgi:hypothetical protein